MKVTVEFDISVDEAVSLQQQYLEFCMKNGVDISINNTRKFFESGAADALMESFAKQCQQAMIQNPFLQFNPFFNNFINNNGGDQ